MDKRVFNVNADCRPDKHYMVDISDRLLEIKNMVDMGQYFTINRARQYGKTTTLKALAKLLQDKYEVVSLDFCGGFSCRHGFFNKRYFRYAERL